MLSLNRAQAALAACNENILVGVKIERAVKKRNDGVPGMNEDIPLTMYLLEAAEKGFGFPNELLVLRSRERLISSAVQSTKIRKKPPT